MKIISIQESNKKDIIFFDSGIKELNDYFVNYALFNDINNIGKTFILYDDNNLIGFYTLSNASISINEIPDTYKSKLPKYPIPCIRIARLAIDKKYQNKGYGRLLLKDAFIKTLAISKKSGLCFVVVDSKPSSKNYYKKFGFTSSKNKELTLLLPIKTLIDVFKYI